MTLEKVCLPVASLMTGLQAAPSTSWPRVQLLASIICIACEQVLVEGVTLQHASGAAHCW